MPDANGIITAENIRGWLAGRLHMSPDDARCVVRGPLQARDYSRLFYAECAALPSAAAIKWCLRPRTLSPDGDAATLEFESLRRVANAMEADGHYTVPRAYFMERERALLAIEWIGGVTMTAAIASWRSRAFDAHGLMVQAGTWLRHFHRAHPLHSGFLDIEDRLRNLSEYDGCPLARMRVFGEGVAELRRSAVAAASVKLERSWIHGDFKMDNLIVSGERIVGIDVQIRYENTVVYDLAPFINHFELAFYHPSLWRLGPGRAQLAAAFLGGYHAAGV